MEVSTQEYLNEAAGELAQHIADFINMLIASGRNGEITLMEAKTAMRAANVAHINLPAFEFKS